MRRNQPFVYIALAIIILFPLAVVAQRAGTSSRDIDVYFSPKGGCTEAVVKELNAAKTSLAVQAYSFTSAPIAEAIANAYKRGVKVVVVLDKSNKDPDDKYTGATYLFNHKVPTYIDSKHAIAHNKVMVIDGQTVITGSFNFTKAAEESNAENLLVMRRPDLAARYQENIAEHLKHSEPYTR